MASIRVAHEGDGMKQAFVGFLLGAMLMMAVPSQAHHTSSNDRLKQQISDLRFSLADVRDSVTDLRSDLNYVTSNHQSQITAVANKTTSLETKTKYLDSYGIFSGPIRVFWSNCYDSEVAYWGMDNRSPYNGVMLGC